MAKNSVAIKVFWLTTLTLDSDPNYGIVGAKVLNVVGDLTTLLYGDNDNRAATKNRAVPTSAEFSS